MTIHIRFKDRSPLLNSAESCLALKSPELLPRMILAQKTSPFTSGSTNSLQISLQNYYLGDSPDPLGPTVFVCGALNWLTYSVTCYEKKIVALDIGAEKYRLLQMPLQFGYSKFSYVLLDVLDGCLVLTNKFGKNNSYFDVWVLKDYEDDNSWIKLLSIKKHDFCLNDHLSPVSFLKEDKTQVFLQEDGCFRFFVFNVETNKLKRVEIHGLTTKNYDHLYAQQMCPPTILRLHDNCGGGRKPSSSTSKTKKASPGFH